MEVHYRGDVWFNIKYLILQTRKQKAPATICWFQDFFFQSFKNILWVFVLRRLVQASSLYKWDTVPGHMKPLLWCKACFCCIIQSSCYNKYHKLLRFLCCSCCSYCYDQVLDGSNLRKDRGILAHGLRVKLRVHHGKDSVAAGYVISTFRK